MTQPEIEGVGHGIPRMLYASDGSNWYAILVDSDGHVKVDVVTAALGTGGATAANQTTMITALQLIDDLRAALDSVATDELDVHVEEFDPVPSSPVNTFATWIDVPTATSTTIVSYTVTNGKTFYLTDIVFTDAGLTAGVEIRGALKVAGGAVMDFHVPAGGHGHISLRTAIKATSAQVVLLEGYQWSGGNKRLAGNLIGFEV